MIPVPADVQPRVLYRMLLVSGPYRGTKRMSDTIMWIPQLGKPGIEILSHLAYQESGPYEMIFRTRGCDKGNLFHDMVGRKAIDVDFFKRLPQG